MELYDGDNFDLEILRGVRSVDVNDFIGNKVWIAVVKDLEARLIYASRLLETAPLEDEFGIIEGTDGKKTRVLMTDGVKRLQGACTELRYLLALPQEFIDRIKEVEEEEKDARPQSE
jgi:hypothetical protein